MTVHTLQRPGSAPVAHAPRSRQRLVLPPGMREDVVVSATVRCLSRRLPRDLAASWPHQLPPAWRAMWHDPAMPTWGEDDFVAELSDEVGLDATRTVVLARAVAAELDERLDGAMSAARHRLPEDVQTVVPRADARRRRTSA